MLCLMYCVFQLKAFLSFLCLYPMSEFHLFYACFKSICAWNSGCELHSCFVDVTFKSSIFVFLIIMLTLEIKILLDWIIFDL